MNLNKEVIIKTAFQVSNQGIGYDGKLPWGHLASDMQQFVEQTSGSAVIMGRKTFWSIPEGFRPLKNRENALVLRDATRESFSEKVRIYSSLTEAIENSAAPKIFVLGGHYLYWAALLSPYATTIIATILYPEKPFECDTFFPKIPDHWICIHETEKKFWSEKDPILTQRKIFKNKRNPFPIGIL